MERKYCITVGREFCSGGIETAKQVADALDMAYYDKEIIDKTAEMMNLNKDIIASHDEMPVSYLQSGAVRYSGQTWGDISNNHLIIDAGTLGIDLSAELICKTIKDLEARVK